MIDFLTADFSTAGRWPAPVRAGLCVAYGQGPAEIHDIRFDAGARFSEVRVSVLTSSGRGEPAVHIDHLDWTMLPGVSLYARCLNLLAVHWFGSLEMPPRAIGAPIWSGLTLTIGRDVATAPRLRFELQSNGHERASVRWSLNGEIDRPWSPVLLSTFDADPLRAVLQHAMHHAGRALLPTTHADQAAAEAVEAASSAAPIHGDALDAAFAALWRPADGEAAPVWS